MKTSSVRLYALTLLLILAGAPAFAQTFGDWEFRCPITLDGYTGSDPLTNFPVLVKLGTNTIAGFSYDQFMDAGGGDLRFAASNQTTELNYEIDSWDTTGVSCVWVQIDELKDTNSLIYAYWGMPASAPAYTTNGGTWSNGYVGVWHMGETNGPLADSSGTGNTGTPVGIDQDVEGVVDGASSFDGVSDHIEVPDDPSLTPTRITVEAWVRPTSVAAWDMIVTKGYNGTCPYDLAIGDTTKFSFGAHTEGAWRLARGSTTPTVGRLYHITGTFDGTAFRIYEDGLQTGTYAWTGNLPAQSLSLGIGDGAWSAFGNYEFSGMIDEVRIASLARSSNWVWASWFNVHSNTAFHSYGVADVQASTLTVRALPASDLTPNSAVLNGTIVHAGDAENPYTYVCWDATDQGTNSGTSAWVNVLSLGTNWGKRDAFSTNVTGLLSGTSYTYRCYVTNSTGWAWSEEVISFKPVYLPAITNTGATNLLWTTTELSGEVVDNGSENPACWFEYWIDGSAATSSMAMGTQGGTFSQTIDVVPDRSYHYSILAVNAAGAVRSGTRDFATLTPHYVWTNGTHTTPFDSWAKAATNIQAAVDACTLPGEAVVVTNGVYAGETLVPNEAAVTISNSIVLMSVNGPDVTVIRPVLNYRRGIDLTATATNAVVNGFTINDANIGTHGYHGAGIRMYAGTVTNCVIDDCYTGGQGGGIWMNAGTVIDCTLTRNHADEWQYGYGGAIYMIGTGCLVENCIITNNYTLSRRGGAGIWMSAGTVRNCLITKNEGRREAVGSESTGGGVQLSGSGLLQHCTIANNYAGGAGGGVYMSGGTIENCIVYGNTVQYTISPDYENVYMSAGTVEYSCAAPAVAGEGNVSTSPEFVDSANDNYGLGAGSSAIDSGTALGITTDLAGNTRPTDGDGVGGAGYDMGCYEAGDISTQPFSCSFLATNTIGLTSLAVEFSASVLGSDTNVQYFWWDFNTNGAPAMTAEGPGLWTVTNTYGIGYYGVSLTVSNASGDVASLSRDVYVQVLPTVLYVATNGNHVAPYHTQANAATDIQSAVDAAYTPAGSDILINVGPGLYPLAQQVSILKPLTVRATNGPTATIMDPSTTQVRSFSLLDPGAVLEGFTMQGASLSHGWGNGGGVYMTGGTVTNCQFQNNVVQDQGGAIFISGGTVVDCVFSNNQANEWQYGYGGAIRMTGGLVDRCNLHHNSSLSKQGGGAVSMSGGILRNCLIWSNRCTRTVAGTEGIGGGVRLYGGAIENCTVSDNYSYGSGGGVYQSGGTVSNSIVYFNEISAGFPSAARNVYATAGTVDSSCSDPLIAGTGNTNLDPEFLGHPTNYLLNAVSPCRNAGSNQTWMVAGVDLLGTNRILEGVVDMGCYEMPEVIGGPLVCNFSTPFTEGFTNLQVVFTASVSGGDTNLTGFWWDYDGDGNADAQGVDLWVVTNSYTSGYYDVSLTVGNGSAETSSVTKASYILVAPEVAYVSTNGTAVAPYMSWAEAANSVQDAVNVGGFSGTAHTLVRVAAGVYGSGVQTLIAKPITLRSEAGPAETVLRATGGERVLSLSHAEILLDGFTVSDCNISTHSYNGGGIYMTAGVVTNCIISDNRVGGRGGGIYLAGGTVADCTFSSNRCTEWQYGYGGGLFVQGNGECVRCVFDGNWTESHRGGGAMYVNGGLVRNCLLVNNSATRTQVSYEGDGGGAVVGNGLMENCTIVHNWAVKDGGGLQMLGSYGRVTNTIVAFNTATTGAQDIDNPVRIAYSCSPDLADGVDGNVTAGPRFVNANAGDYRLRGSSPCRDTGYEHPWAVSGQDLLHNDRSVSGSVDMGAYEVPPLGTMIVIR